MTTSYLRGLFLRGPGLLALLLVGLVLPAPAQDTAVEPVRVIAIFAHPDDGRWCAFERPVPQDLQRVIDALARVT